MNTTETTPLRVAIVGAGPAGFYAAEALLKGRESVDIDLIDRLPTPYGLVRYGVAPDHPKIKSVIRLYERTAADPRVHFLGNVEYGTDLTNDDLKRHYHATIYAVGSPSDRRLGIDGEELPGCLSATEFVAWYNGHPDYVELNPDLSIRAVAVIGMGNVAVDVARVLAKSADELRATDIADHALEALTSSQVEEIYMVGRRGPAQGKFTTKELRELGELKNADIVIEPSQLEIGEASLESIANNVVAKRNLDVLKSFATLASRGRPRRLHLIFLASPTAILGCNRVDEIELERNRLELTEGGIRAVGTGERSRLQVGMVLRSVGYQGLPLPKVPFDSKRHIIPNTCGRVLDSVGGTPVKGEYVAGWIKRGPTGVIGTNKADAQETVMSLLEDDVRTVAKGASRRDAVEALLQGRGACFVQFKDWQKLNAFEMRCGEDQGRPRIKVTSVAEMLERCEVS